jgi:hypothetical protein
MSWYAVQFRREVDLLEKVPIHVVSEVSPRIRDFLVSVLMHHHAVLQDQR